MSEPLAVAAVGTGTLADAVAQVRPYLPQCLVPTPDADRMSAIAGLLPGVLATGFGFECHLGEQPPHADFFVRIKASEVGRNVLAGTSAAGTLPAALAQHPTWRRLGQVSRDWADPTHVLNRCIDNVWLEFDVDAVDRADPGPAPLPSVFFGAYNGISSRIRTGSATAAQAYGWLTYDALPRMLGRALFPPTEQMLVRTLDALPPGANVFQVGVMLARATDAVRLCIVDLPTDQVAGYLAGLGWPGPPSELRSVVQRLATFVDRVIVDIDVGRSLSEKVGLECYMTDYRQPGNEPRWELFLDHLVDTGLCRPEQRAGLLGYPGYVREAPGTLPRHVAAASSLLGTRASSGHARVLHHMKIAYRPGAPLEAKAYLGGVHHWLTSSPS